MLQGITRGPRKPDTGEVVSRLMECHVRIRHHAAIATRLGDATGVRPDEIAAAAWQCVRYFSEALPHHSADEDDSIAVHLPVAASAFIERMTKQHAAIHALLDQLVPLWRSVARSPERHAEHSGQLAALAAALNAMFVEHLALEESVIFPAIDALSATVQKSIVDEMVARRASVRAPA